MIQLPLLVDVFPGKSVILVFRKLLPDEPRIDPLPVWFCHMTTDGFNYHTDGQRVKELTAIHFRR